MSRIFISYFNGIKLNEQAMPVFYDAFIHGLEKAGNQLLIHTSFIWTTDFPDVPKELLKKIKDFDPDLIIIFNGYFYHYDFGKDFCCPVLVYEVDSPLFYANKDILKSVNNNYKYIVSSTSSIKVCRNDFGVSENRCIKLPFFSSVQAEDVKKECNISFIGTDFGFPANVFAHYILDHPNEKDYLMNQLDFIKSYNESVVISPFSVGDLYGIISHYKRLDVLKSISDLGLNLYGYPSWNNNVGLYFDLIKNYQLKRVYSLQHNQDIYNSSKIGISIAHHQAKAGFPWRIMDIMASNACLVSDYHSDFEEYFPGFKFPIYESAYEAREICKRLLDNPNERNDIIADCQERIEKEFRFKDILNRIENFVGVCLKSDNVGTVEFLPVLKRFISDDIKTNEYKLVNLRIKKRFKIIMYCFLAILLQIPIIDLLYSRKKRKKMIKSIRKYWR